MQKWVKDVRTPWILTCIRNDIENCQVSISSFSSPNRLAMNTANAECSQAFLQDTPRDEGKDGGRPSFFDALETVATDRCTL